jgi:hypothetical protein
VWVGSFKSESLVEFSNAGVVLSGSAGYRSGDQLSIVGVAVDGSGDVWLTTADNAINKIIGAGTPVVTPLAVGVKNNMLGTRP